MYKPECTDTVANVECSSMHDTSNKQFVSYKIYNGTVVNSIITSKDYAREVLSFTFTR